MNKLVVSLLVCLIGTSAFAAEPERSEELNSFYAIGQVIARQLAVFSLAPAELDMIKEGLTDAVTGKPSRVDLSVYGPKLQQLAQSRSAAASEKNVRLGREFAEKAEKESGAVKTTSGLVYVPLKEGAGASPKDTDTVKVNYRGTLIDGTEFDSSYKRNQPAEFKLDSVIKCWTEGVQKMKVGGKAKLVCPASIAYGDRGTPGAIPPGATLAFEVELLEIKK